MSRYVYFFFFFETREKRSNKRYRNSLNHFNHKTYSCTIKVSTVPKEKNCPQIFKYLVARFQNITSCWCRINTAQSTLARHEDLTPEFLLSRAQQALVPKICRWICIRLVIAVFGQAKDFQTLFSNVFYCLTF